MTRQPETPPPPAETIPDAIEDAALCRASENATRYVDAAAKPEDTAAARFLGKGNPIRKPLSPMDDFLPRG